MARKPQVNPPQNHHPQATALRKQLLLARCELDRRELSAEIRATRERVRSGVAGIARYGPWVLLASPVAGLLASRYLKGCPLTLLTTLALQLRPLLPVILSFLRRR
jgi:hypothetical protein